MRVLALITTYNEARFIGDCLAHLIGQGVEAYVCDNASTDDTVSIASRFLGHGLRGIEHIPRDGVFRWRQLLQRKEELAAELEADWFFHLDADEILLPPRGDRDVVSALTAVDAAGWNAVQLSEFTFVPTHETPDHDHADYRRTMRWYYPFEPKPMHLVRGWKRQPERVNLVGTGGHVVNFPERRIFPGRFRLRHHLFVSRAHWIRKYAQKVFDPDELRDGWHGWRSSLHPDAVKLPHQADLRMSVSDDDLDPSSPRTRHCVVWPE